MQVWESNTDALIQFQHDNFASDVACIIENDLILDAVYALAKESPNVEILNKARIQCVRLPRDSNSNHSELQLEDGRNFSCDLLIGADGANSVVRKEMNVDVFSLNYDRMGLVATLELGEDACELDYNIISEDFTRTHRFNGIGHHALNVKVQDAVNNVGILIYQLDKPV